MNRRKFLGIVGGAMTWPLAAHAQQPARMPEIGLLCATNPTAAAGRIEAFRNGLRELGYVEGKNIAIASRCAYGKFNRLPTLAAELVRRRVSAIVTLGGVDTRAAKKATSTIPIVMLQDPDPITSGFVTDLARPDGNITGLSRLTRQIGAKRLEVLREIVPKLSRLAVLGMSRNPINAPALREVQEATMANGVALQYLDVLSSDHIEVSFQAATDKNADAMLVLPGPAIVPARRQIARLAAKHRLPAIYDRKEFVEAGGLISYGASITDLARRGATYVDKILKGAMPGDLPIELPTKFELAINLKAANAIGIKFPQSILLQATDVVE
jgi:putative ABC transport system substrate-binding protein